MEQNTITKRTLLWKGLPYSQFVLLMFGIALLIIAWKFSYSGVRPENYGIMVIIGLWLVIGNGITFITRIFDLIICFDDLRTQERTLNFNFNEEMKKNNVTVSKFESSDWYIMVENYKNPVKRFVFVVLKKEYIKTLSELKTVSKPSLAYKKLPFIPPYGGIEKSMTVTMFNGRKQKIITYRDSKILNNFETWYKKKN